MFEKNKKKSEKEFTKKYMYNEYEVLELKFEFIDDRPLFFKIELTKAQYYGRQRGSTIYST